MCQFHSDGPDPYAASSTHFQNPHSVQQAISSESMPVLSSAVGIFKVFMSEWEELTKSCPKLSPLINVGLKWARKYYSLMDNTDAYIVTMGESFFFILFYDELTMVVVLNPCICLQWIKDEWENNYVTLAETTMLNLVSAC